MATPKVRIENPNNYLVIVGLSNGISREVKPGAFVMIDPEEVEYLAATTSFFTDKHLIIKDQKVVEELGLDPEETHYVTDEELAKILKSGKVADFHKYIDSLVGNLPQIIRVRDMASELDLASSRVKYINEKLNVEI